MDPAIAVITFTSVTGNIVALLGGILVFHDPNGQTHRRTPRGSQPSAWSSSAPPCSPDATAPAHRNRPTPPLDPRRSDRNPAAGRELTRARVCKVTDDPWRRDVGGPTAVVAGRLQASRLCKARKGVA